MESLTAAEPARCGVVLSTSPSLFTLPSTFRAIISHKLTRRTRVDQSAPAGRFPGKWNRDAPGVVNERVRFTRRTHVGPFALRWNGSRNIRRRKRTLMSADREKGANGKAWHIQGASCSRFRVSATSCVNRTVSRLHWDNVKLLRQISILSSVRLSPGDQMERRWLNCRRWSASPPDVTVSLCWRSPSLRLSGDAWIPANTPSVNRRGFCLESGGSMRDECRLRGIPLHPARLPPLTGGN